MSIRELRGDNIIVEAVPSQSEESDDWINIYVVEIPVIEFQRMRVRIIPNGRDYDGALRTSGVDVSGESFVRVYIEAR